MQFPLEDILVDDQRIIIGEGINPSDHFVDEYAQGPPVNRLAVALVLQDLRSEVFGGATEGESAVLDDFGETEVRQLEVPVYADQDVLRLQVAVDYVAGMQMLENRNDVRCVKTE